MPRILLVEDDVQMRPLIRRMLESAGHEVLEAKDGLAAYEAVRDLHDRLDLVITDLVMPRMDGVELAGRVRAEYPELRILCMSGYADPRSPRGYPVLTKPFTPRRLLEAIDKAIATPPPPTSRTAASC